MTDNIQNVVSGWRFSLTVLLLAGLASLLVWRVLSLQVLDTERGYEFLQGQGNARTIRTETMPAYRGVISDRNGEPLAVSTPVVSIWMNPKHLMKEEDKWGVLASALSMPSAQLEKKIRSNARRGFIYLRRHLSPADAKKITDLGITGVYGQREYKRFYPAGEVAAHLVGFTNIDDQGQEGMELAFEERLQGQPGSKRVLKDLRGNIIRDIEQKQPAISGKDLALSIDLRLQYLAYRELKAALKKVNAKSGSVVVLDSATGEVLAMVNQPSYNPNNRRQLKPASVRNRAVTDLFEPGSTVKPLTIVAALESGRYKPHTPIDTNPGHIRVGKKTLLDPVNYGVIDVTGILTKSSQVGTSKLALSLDEQDIRSVFERVGFGEITGSGFPGERMGLLPDRPNWRDIEKVNLAFGYGLAVTPLQLAQAYSVFASGGKFQPATLLRKEQKDVEPEQVIPARITGQVIEMLKTVTARGGTGTRAQVASYSVVGKTGTVHKVGKHGYEDDRYISVFAGLAPASDPRLVTVVMIDEPRSGKYYGGEVAAPVFSKVVSGALRLLDVTPDQLEVANKKPPLKAVVTGRRKSA